MKDAAQTYCLGSKANGSLMRATPLAIWGYKLTNNELARLAFSDSGLSHPNPSCCEAVACYIIAVASLIRYPKDTQRAFDRVFSWAKSYVKSEVIEWLKLAKDNVDYPYHPQAGFVKIAFIHAFRHLMLGTTYLNAIEETVAGGGDTDTNACIVGGLLGACYGEISLPEDMKKKVLDCTTRGRRHRPDFLSTSHIPLLVQQMINSAPTTLNNKNSLQ